MKIRVYNDDSDQNSVISLWKSIFSYDAAHNDPLMSIKRKVKQKDNLFFVAESGEKKIVGTVMAGYDGHRGWIYSLAVDPSERNRGVGSMLLKHAEKELLKLDCPKINLQILSSNKEVINFYKRNGYEIEGRISMGKKFVK